MNRSKRFFICPFAILSLLFLSGSAFSYTPVYEPYKPYYPLLEGPENITAMCGTSLASCTACADNRYKHDCVYYYAQGPSDCTTVYDKKSDIFSCVVFLFKQKVQDPTKIKSTCDIIGNPDERTDSVNWCLSYLVPEYGNDPQDCFSILDQKNTVDLRDGCIADYAEKRQEPQHCALVTLSVDQEMSCCLRAKNKDAGSKYITTRQDLIDAFMAEYKDLFEECKIISKIIGPAVSDKCEKVNCDCLDPCNGLASDAEKQRACVSDCTGKYVRCYGEERILFTPEKNAMFMQQSFYGIFSRKHCLGHSFLPDSVGDKMDFAIEGTITDTDNHPLPYMRVSVNASGKTSGAYTDDKGVYKVSLSQIGIEPGKSEIPAELVLYFSYDRGGKNYYALWYGPQVSYTHKFKLKTAADIKQDIKLDGNGGADDRGSTALLTDFRHIGAVYYHMSEAVEFALSVLKADIDYKLPVDVYLAAADGTYYNRDSSYIHINFTDTAYSSSNKPKNREYHEFAHHLLFSQWNGQGLRGAGDKNHGGYINSNTGDSYTEGFAEFTALAISKFRGDPAPSVYQDFGDLENNYKAWSMRGYYEELAVAGILWDLYDDKNDRGDTISLPLDRMWSVMKVRRNDFYEYYKAFKAEFPDKSVEIDNIFKEHGFFADKHPGNKVRDPEEPFKDTNGNGGYDAGEPFVDYGNIEGLVRPWMQYEEGYVIGKATNYERENRTQTVRLPEAYLKITDQGAKNYKIAVHYVNAQDGMDYEYSVGASNGLIYVNPLPEDIEATLTIKPDEKEYAAETPYVITNKDYIVKYLSVPLGQGFFDTHTFGLKPTGAAANVGDKYEPSVPGKTGGETGNAGQGQEDSEPVSDVSIPLVPVALAGVGVLMLGGAALIVLLIAVVLVYKKKKK